MILQKRSGVNSLKRESKKILLSFLDENGTHSVSKENIFAAKLAIKYPNPKFWKGFEFENLFSLSFFFTPEGKTLLSDREKEMRFELPNFELPPTSVMEADSSEKPLQKKIRPKNLSDLMET